MKLLKIIIGVLFISILTGCSYSSGRYHTGRVLMPAEMKLTAALDNMVITDDFKERSISLSPHFGVDLGLPADFEIGIHTNTAGKGEVGFRYGLFQDSALCDLSLDLSYSSINSLSSTVDHLNYGFSLSKDYGSISPYLYYNRMQYIKSYHEKNDDNNWITDAIRDIIEEINSESTLSYAGVGIEISPNKIFAFNVETAYLAEESHLNTGYWYLSTGFSLKLDFLKKSRTGNNRYKRNRRDKSL